MDYHHHARLTIYSREELAKSVVEGRLSLREAAAERGLSRQSASKWVKRFREGGPAALQDRSSRPHRSSRSVAPELVERVERLRRERWTGVRIAQATGLSRATVSRILTRLKLNKAKMLEPKIPIVRYEHAAPAICCTSTSRSWPASSSLAMASPAILVMRPEAQGRHKKQTGGHGQFGDCKIRMEPLPRGGGFEFGNEVFGGAVPRNFIPAVEKGIVESAARGYLAGFPVVDFKATIYDGSYHDVDSNEMSFKMAGRLAFRKCMESAKPCLLEPVMKVEIEAPDEFAGALMGDLNSRRGRVQGMESKGRTTVINAEVPMAEMLTYGTILTSMTQGKGSYHMEMNHYDIVPQLVAEKILANAKRPVEEEEE